MMRRTIAALAASRYFGPYRATLKPPAMPGVMTLSLQDDTIVVEPKRIYTLETLMKGYTGPKPTEYDWGEPAGKEMW
jgi:hypothetical protein